MTQAESHHSTRTSRRSILRGVAAAPAVSVVGLHDFLADADLVTLGNRLDAARAAEKAVHEKWADFDSRDANRAIEAAHDKIKEIVRQIEGIPAETMRGVQVKMRAVAWCRDDDPFEDDPIYSRTTDVRIALSIYNDLQAMGA